MNESQFEELFERLTNNAPLRWQKRLFFDHFASSHDDNLPRTIDLPTGLGKTMVMVIWLIAWAVNKLLPRRLIYVVDRRTVVDQATDLASSLKKKLKENAPGVLGDVANLAVSTLRGQLADNRDWSRDLSRPAIIIGTVDLIGSALLFSGYRSSYKRRPLEAGLLGQDSLLVLDEAHLSKPFEKLLRSIESFQSTCGMGVSSAKPLCIIRMSATGGTSDKSKTFTLQFDEAGRLTGEDAKDPTTVERFGANKKLTVKTLGQKDKLVDRLAREAIELVDLSNPERKPVVGQRIVVFTRKPDDARAIADAIRKHDAKKNSPGPYATVVEVLTGTMRGLERDQLVEKPVFKDRWLNGNLKPDDPSNRTPVFLISTSAGEVGFDLNADHMVCDAAPLDSLVQRLGRVNRRGTGDATVVLLTPFKPDDTSVLTDGMDVSPQALTAFKSKLTAEELKAACSPEPTAVELTDILLDAWSMTSITDRMPGRPEVGPWLRGVDDQLPQTTVAWRGELDLVKDHSDPTKTLQKIFAKHPIRSHESITTNSYHVAEFLKLACKLKDRPSELPSIRVALRLSRGPIVLRTIRQLADDPGILYAEPTLILPATLGGLDQAGMLDAESIPELAKAAAPPPRSLDVADYPGYEQREGATPRLRLLVRRTDDGSWVPESLPGGVVLSERLQLQTTYPTSTALFADLPNADLRIRLVQPIEFDDEGAAVRSLVMLSPISNRNKPEDQSLDDHVGAVEAEAERIAGALGLATDDPIRIALLFAARWHDEGKKAEVWQRFVYGPDGNGQCKGKSSESRDPKSLRGYRHEFGSLLRVHYSDRCDTTGCVFPADRDARELALHLIATHHGAGRPHFEPAIYTPFTTAERDAIHTDSIQRFARLQRKYGWWRIAWLENLLRCADAMASADAESEDDPTGAEGGDA